MISVENASLFVKMLDGVFNFDLLIKQFTELIAGLGAKPFEKIKHIH